MRRALGVIPPALAFLSALMVGACGDSPVAPSLPELEMVVAGGDGQYGTGGLLEQPLRALVRAKETGTAQADVTVFWTVEEGDGTLGGSAATVTDSDGVATQTLRLGTSAGTVRVKATVQQQQTAAVQFQAYLVAAPELTSLSTTSARAGDVISLEGTNFSAMPDEDVVLFSGIRGRVVSAASTALDVEVPRCLPDRAVEVTAQLGSVRSQALTLSVQGGGEMTSLEVGASLDVDDPAGLTCVRLSGADGARYLAVVTSASTVGAARWGFALSGLADPGGVAAASPTPIRAPAPSVSPAMDYGERFEIALRRREAELVRGGVSRPSAAEAAPARVTVPSVGDKRSFKVQNGAGGFIDVTAVARYVGSQAVLYVDETAPQGGFDATDLATLAGEFDDVIYPTVTRVFGAPSDLDGNGRVAILFTPAVNRLTPRGSDGFVGGFFYGLDLMDQDGSNHGEVFYALVPDPTGQYSDPRPKSRVMDATPAILAHEFQHMVHFNQRMLVLGASNTEALWLSEGLAQMSEELVARAYAARGDSAGVERHRAGNRTRALRFLADPSAVSLIVTTGAGSLEERGAGWLHVLYLWDRGGGDDVLGRLTRTTLTGTANVTAVMGASWPSLVADWESALYLDDLGPVPYPYEYPNADLRELLRTSGSSYPLDPEALGGADFTQAGSLWSSSARHYIVEPPSTGSVTLRLGGEAGGDVPKSASLRLRLVRLS